MHGNIDALASAGRRKAILKLAAGMLRRASGPKTGTVLESRLVSAGNCLVRPDIAYVRGDRRGIIREKNLMGAPDLVVEVAGGAAGSKSLKLKKNVYERLGVQEIWLVDPDSQTLEVLVWSEIGYLKTATHRKSGHVRSKLFRQAAFPLKEIFASADPRSRCRNTG